MKTNMTEMVFILDRSGSMSGLEQDTIGGYNSLLEKQKNEVGEAVVTTVLFYDQYELLHEGININDVAPITSTEYFVRGSTALLDAIGKTISSVKDKQQKAETERPEKTIFAIVTDGMENCSMEYSYEKVKSMIEAQKKLGWEFLFIGANIDAIGEAGKIGISANNAVRYTADSVGTSKVYESMDKAFKQMRSSASLSHDWKQEIEHDHKERGEKKEKGESKGIMGKLREIVKKKT